MAKSKSAKKKAKQRSLKADGDQESNAVALDVLSSQESYTKQSSSQSTLRPSPAPSSQNLEIKSLAKGKGKSLNEPSSSIINGSTITANPTSADDLAMELLMAKEALSKVEQLQNEVTRLKKELNFKNEVIIKLQEELAAKSNTPVISSSTSAILSSTSDISPSMSDAAISNSLIRSNTSNQARDVALQCSICVDYFSSPYTVECGHTFCYTCLHSWLEIHKSCPTCRTKLLRRPTLSFNLREQVQSSIQRLPELERTVAMKKLQEDEENVKRLERKGDVWKDIFRHISFGSGSILDDDDGVRRCVSCGWEVAGGSCVNCNTLFSDAGESDDSQEHSDAASEPDQYDSHDSFINDDEEIYEEAWSDNGSGSEEDEEDEDIDEMPVRRRKLIAKRPNIGQIRGSRTVVNISDDSESEHDSSEQSGASSSANTSILGEDSEELDDILLKSRHKKSRRSLIVLDDDEDEESEEEETLIRNRKFNNSNKTSKPTKNNTNSTATVASSSSSLTTAALSVNTLKRNVIDSKKNTMFEIPSSSDSDSEDDFVGSSTPQKKKQKTRMEDLFS